MSLKDSSTNEKIAAELNKLFKDNFEGLVEELNKNVQPWSAGKTLRIPMNASTEAATTTVLDPAKIITISEANKSKTPVRVWRVDFTPEQVANMLADVGYFKSLVSFVILQMHREILESLGIWLDDTPVFGSYLINCDASISKGSYFSVSESQGAAPKASVFLSSWCTTRSTPRLYV